MKAIQMINSKTFYTEARGNKMTLKFCDILNRWEMYTDNAAHRAYRGAGVKCFVCLGAVEKSYKSWRGIAQLVESLNNDTAN